MIVGDVRYDRVPPRASEVTHQIKVRVEDVNAHFVRALERGAEILMGPTDHEYGEREYDAADPWGHRWQYAETRADVDPASWGGVLKQPG